MSIFNDYKRIEVKKIIDSKEAVNAIERLKEEPFLIRKAELDEWCQKFLLGRQGYRAVAIEILRSPDCPKEYREKLTSSTTDKDVLFASLSQEKDKSIIRYKLNSIGKEYMIDIAKEHLAENWTLQLSKEVIQICATEKMEEYGGLYLNYCEWSKELEKCIEDNGLTEEGATYILNNPNISPDKKVHIFNEYGYVFESIDYEKVPVQVINEIFNVSMETLFSNEDVSIYAKKQAQKAIGEMYEKNVISSFQIDDFCKKYEKAGVFSQEEYKSLYKKIVMTAKDPMVFKGREFDIAYRNPNFKSSTINTETLIRISKMVDEIKKSKTAPTSYSQVVIDTTNNFIFGKQPNKIVMDAILDLHKQRNKPFNNLHHSVMAMAIMANPRIESSQKTALIRQYDDDNLTKIKPRLRMLYEISEQLKYATVEDGLSEYSNAIIPKFSEEDIDYIMATPLFVNGLDTEPTIKTNRYISQSQMQTLSYICAETIRKYPEFKSDIELLFQTVERKSKPQILYKEYGAFFTSCDKYMLPKNKENKTFDILKVDKFSKKDMIKAYDNIEDEQLRELQGMIEKAVEEQDDITLQYYLFSKYKRQYDIIEEVLFQRERELIKVWDKEDDFVR